MKAPALPSWEYSSAAPPWPCTPAPLLGILGLWGSRCARGFDSMVHEKANTTTHSTTGIMIVTLLYQDTCRNVQAGVPTHRAALLIADEIDRLLKPLSSCCRLASLCASRSRRRSRTCQQPSYNRGRAFVCCATASSSILAPFQRYARSTAVGFSLWAWTVCPTFPQGRKMWFSGSHGGTLGYLLRS